MSENVITSAHAVCLHCTVYVFMCNEKMRADAGDWERVVTWLVWLNWKVLFILQQTRKIYGLLPDK